MSDSCTEHVKLFKALSDPNRIEIIDMLSRGEMCACKLLEKFGISQPTLSHHMKMLRECGLVRERREGKWAYYSLNDDTVREFRAFLQQITVGKLSCLAPAANCCQPESSGKVIESVKDYYGKQLQGTKDLKTKTCSCAEKPSAEVRAILPLIADEIKERSYGCGSPLPPLLAGTTVLDLGCGTGKDVYIASKLVGEEGRVIGVDMTEEQLAVARQHQEEQRLSFGYQHSNVELLSGYIEDLSSLGISDASVDVVISNCVINLSPNKEQVFREIRRVLRPGGELIFADVFADRRIPAELTADPVLRGECLGGALYTEDFRRLMAACGWKDVRFTEVRSLAIDSEEIQSKIGFVGFTSRTVRAFKLDDLEDVCEDYGQVAYYDGSIPGHESYFDLDDHHRFFTGRPLLVCGNTASMLTQTRYRTAFRVVGDRSVHYGKFAGCGARQEPQPRGGSSCC